VKSKSKLTNAGTILPAVIGGAVYVSLAIVAFDFTFDDTFISMRYAKNLAEYGEIVWNQGEQVKVEGYSNFLWVVLLVLPFRFLPVEPLLTAKLLSFTFALTAVFVCSFLTYRMSGRWLPTLFATLLMVLSMPFVVWGVSGMEASLYVFLILLAIYLHLVEDEHRLLFVTPLVLFCISITRTEGIVFYFSAVLARTLLFLFKGDMRYSWRNRRWIYWNGLFVALFSSYLTWKYLYYGSLISLPMQLKQASGLEGVHYVRDLLLRLRPFVPLAVIGIIFTARQPSRLYPVLALSLYFAAIAFSNPIQGIEFRLLIAAIPLVYLLAVLGVDDLSRRMKPPWRVITLVILLTGLVLWVTGNPLKYPSRLKSMTSDSTVLQQIHIPMGKWLDRLSKSQGRFTVAVADAGAIVFYSNCDAIDFFGLNDVEFAKYGFTPERLLKKSPEFIVLKSSSPTDFKGTDTQYGELSDLIYTNPEFQKFYEVRKIWTSVKPFFYCLWLFQRRDAA